VSADVVFAVDTALSWDGDFRPLPGDWFVELHGDTILVSARYVAAVDAVHAATIAVDAWTERYGGADAPHVYAVRVRRRGAKRWTAVTVAQTADGDWAGR